VKQADLKQLNIYEHKTNRSETETNISKTETNRSESLPLELMRDVPDTHVNVSLCKICSYIVQVHGSNLLGFDLCQREL
jgi:hypothetical protein